MGFSSSNLISQCRALKQTHFFIACNRLSLDSNLGNRPRWLKAKPKGQVTKGQATPRDKALTRAEAKESNHKSKVVRLDVRKWTNASKEARGNKPIQAKSEENLMEEQHPSK